MAGSSRELVMSWIVASALVAGLIAGPTWWQVTADRHATAELRTGSLAARILFSGSAEHQVPLSYDRVDRDPASGHRAAAGE